MSISKFKMARRKLKSSRILDLTPEEILFYSIYRWEKTLKKRPWISVPELIYLWSETGKGNCRFDPFLLKIILNHPFFKRITVKQHGLDIITKDDIKDDGDIKKTAEAFDRFSSGLNSHVDNPHLKLALLNCLKQNFSVLHLEAKDATHFDAHLGQGKKRILLRFINRPDWLYPSDRLIWDLYAASKEKRSFPAIFSYKIHGSCFEIFKITKIFGWQTYAIFTEQNFGNKKFARLELPTVIQNRCHLGLDLISKYSSRSNTFVEGDFSKASSQVSIEAFKSILSNFYGVTNARRYLFILEGIKNLKSST